MSPTLLALAAGVLLGLAAVSPALAAGNGAGSGGAGAQRAINSGLPPGEPGPLGSPNNRRPAVEPPSRTPAASGPGHGVAVPDK